MRINSTEISLSLALHTLRTAVLPEATSDSSRNAINNIRLVLVDLLRRQGPAVEFLSGCIENGEALCSQIEEALGPKLPNGSLLPAVEAAENNFEALIEIHDQVTKRLNSLCTLLIEKTPADPRASSILRIAAEWELSYYAGLQALPVDPFGDRAAHTPAPEPPLSPEFLQAFLRTHRKDSTIEVADFTPVPGGYGNQTFFCTLKYHASGLAKEEQIVVRKSVGIPIVLSLEQEYDLLCSLKGKGFPAPVPMEIASKLPGVDGTFYTMNRIPGSMASSFAEGKQANFPEKFLLRLAELLGKLHSIPLDTFTEYISTYNDTSVLHETIEQRHHRKIAYWQKYSQDVDHPPSPHVTFLFNWLEQNVPKDSRRPVLAHGDFNVHNILREGDEVTGVLDWECSDFGAPELDLAYIQPTVSAHMDWNRFIDHYYAYGGQRVNPASMLFCAAYAGMRLALAAGRFSLNLQRGVNRDIRFINVEQGLAVIIIGMGLGTTKAAEGLKSLQAQAGVEEVSDVAEVKQPSNIVEPTKVEDIRAEAVHVEIA
jgi:aminoglycoside phosphotransferase (APT) family kinase protein